MKRSRKSRRDFDDVECGRRQVRTCRRPHMLTNEGERIGKRGKRFCIPGRLTNRQRLLLEQLMSKDRDQRKESEQGRGGAQELNYVSVRPTRTESTSPFVP
jgi:hypothetical protein